MSFEIPYSITIYIGTWNIMSVTDQFNDQHKGEQDSEIWIPAFDSFLQFLR